MLTYLKFYEYFGTRHQTLCQQEFCKNSDLFCSTYVAFSFCFFHWRTLMITAHSKATDSVLSLRCNISEQKDNHTLVLFRPLVAHHPSLPKNLFVKLTNCIKSHSTIKDNQLAHKTKASTKLPKEKHIFLQFLSHNSFTYTIQYSHCCLGIHRLFHPYILCAYTVQFSYIVFFFFINKTIIDCNSNIPSIRYFLLGGSILCGGVDICK